MQKVGLAETLHQVGPLKEGIAAGTLKLPANDTDEMPLPPLYPPPLHPMCAAEHPAWLQRAAEIDEIEVSYDPARRILWQFMAPQERPSFTPKLIAGMTSLLNAVDAACEANPQVPPVAHLVLGSRTRGIFNLGGDLNLFLDAITRGDRGRLRFYAHNCVKGQHRFATNLGRSLCTIALVQGDALGGGFEVALAQQVIVAERQARFGLPEVLFNLFPGMGAYSFLSRRINAAEAERMIISGRVYSAEEMHEMGVVDILAEDGQGVNVVHDFVGDYGRTRRTRQATFRARSIVSPIRLDELLEIADLWVETALALERSDLRRMRHLATAQSRRCARLQK